MSSLLTQAYLLEQYGPRLDTSQIGEVLGYTAAVVRNKLADGSLNLKVYRDGQLFCDYRDMGEYLDAMRLKARPSAGADSPA